MDDRHYYGPPPPDMGPPPPPPKPPRKVPKQSPQSTVHQFWQKFSTQYPGKVFAALPSNPHARQKRHQRASYSGKRVAKSYDEARAECERDVDRIIKECRRTNQRYRDLHFDIEWDLKSGARDCLDGLENIKNDLKPKGVKRVTDIFQDPQFYINGPTAGDVRQGLDGDCYLMAALCGLGGKEGLINRVCVKHDVQVGVYGFVFYRDGEWQQTIVDDKLYLRAPDYDEATDERAIWDDINRTDSEEEYRKAHQSGSRALYFAQCSEENETWLPLLEKAYAKAHGDFSAIDGGFTGEAVEDLTGGVTTEIYSTDILDKEAFWRDELMHVNKDFLFGCATGFYVGWLDPQGKMKVEDRDRQGIATGHAYSILEARELKGRKLLKVRNPWGKKEWDGRWSDGSAEWDAEWMQLLDHKFGNDGVFWISYEDLLKKYQHFDRTRIFTDKEWTVSQAWVGVDVGWSAEYHSTRFLLTVKEKGPVVIALSQLDDTYFHGLEGPYVFNLQFRLEEAKEGSDPDDYIVRSNGAYAMARSVNADIELDAGTYVVLMKITATKDASKDTIEDVLAEYVEHRRDKLIQMGLSYDLAHAKGVYVESAEERKKRKTKAEEKRRDDKERMKRKMKERAEKDWRKSKMRHDREKARRKGKKQPVGFDGDESTKSRQGSGSLDAQAAVSAMNGEGFAEKGRQLIGEQHNGPAQQNMPIRIKSFRGETVQEANPAKEAQGVPPVPPPTRQVTKEGDAISLPRRPEPLAEGIVQSLDEVMKAADDETGATHGTQPAVISTATPPAEAVEMPPTPIVQVNGQDAITDVKPLPNLPPLSTPEHITHQSAQLDDAQQPNFEKNNSPNRQNTFPFIPTNGFREGDDDNISISSYPSFDWDSTIDVPSDYDATSSSSSSASDTDDDEVDERRLSVDPGDPPRPNSSYSSSSSSDGSILYKPPTQTQVNRRGRYGPRGRVIRDDSRGRPPPPDVGDGNKDEGAEEPWNAVCVVGLRVYSKNNAGNENAGVELKVVWGDVEDDEARRRKRKERRRARKMKKKGVDGNEGEGGEGKGEEKMSGSMSASYVRLDPDDQGKGMMSPVTASPTTGDDGAGI